MSFFNTKSRFQFPDRELVERIKADMLGEANEYLLAYKDDDQPEPSSFGNGTYESSIPKEGVNKGTFAIDASCALTNI